jgi:hypothetical protein
LQVQDGGVHWNQPRKHAKTGRLDLTSAGSGTPYSAEQFEHIIYIYARSQEWARAEIFFSFFTLF